MKINYNKKRETLFPQYKLDSIKTTQPVKDSKQVNSVKINNTKVNPVSTTVWRHGTGFRVSIVNLKDYNVNSKQTILNFIVGKSHPMLYEVPNGIDIEIAKTATSRTISSKQGNLQEVGRVKAEIMKRCPFNRNTQTGMLHSEKAPMKKAVKGAKGAGAKK